jgi:hypothetical protein
MSFFNIVNQLQWPHALPIKNVTDDFRRSNDNAPRLYLPENKRRNITVPINKDTYDDKTLTVHSISDYRKSYYSLTLVPDVKVLIDVLIPTEEDKRCTLTL